MSEEELGALDSLSISATLYDPHTIITRQGDTDHRIFIIHSGWGCVHRDLPNGERQIIDTPLPSDIIGLQAGDGSRGNSLSSITALSVFEIPHHTLGRALSYKPALGRILSRAVARQNAIVVEHLVNIGRRSALERTAHLLLELADRLAEFGSATPDRYECPLTQDELADALGLTKIHVNRTLRELRERELLVFRNGFVELLNRKKLIGMCGFDSQYVRQF
ncbi:Crp/Fnr family transcriptional regulator [Mesorhizobium xinjiangense]|uniref:Crp/Fnr family transcriptional regulator n=1 Tax=Mesorhizobium xinjiangense TaxID=2678685 RepID=UPI001F197B28|nr:Crp/Fnr family transcriptional regulator [Mesorhizobium xinjiangense]